MPLPVIADTYRVTFEWTRYAGVMPRNVIHVRVNTGTVAEVGAGVVAELKSAMFDDMSQNHVLPTISVLKLDGTSAASQFGVPTAVHGGSSSTDFIAQGCTVVTLHTDLRGPAHRGRVYVGPIVETQQTQGILNDTATTKGAWEQFRDALFDNHGLHLNVASYKHATQRDVTDILVNRVVSTQRRRANQLR